MCLMWDPLPRTKRAKHGLMQIQSELVAPLAHGKRRGVATVRGHDQGGSPLLGVDLAS